MEKVGGKIEIDRTRVEIERLRIIGETEFKTIDIHSI